MYDNSKKRPLAQSILDIDRELANLLAKRAMLLHKANSGRKGTDPSLEKQLRQAWETNAARLSRDPRFIRQFFALMQEIEANTRDEEEQRSGFNLAPPRRPVAVAIKGPSSSRATRLWLALGTAAGTSLSISNALLNDPLNDFVKAFNQSGARLSWDDSGKVYCKDGGELDFTDRVVYIGEDALNLYLMIFLSVGKPSRLKLTGGSDLKMADLTPLSHFLPQLGARMTNVVPKTKGLPVRLECSGVLPDVVTIPADLPADALTALFLAAAFWEAPTTFIMDANPHAATSAAEVLAMLRSSAVDASSDGNSLRVAPGNVRPPKTPAMDMDALIATALLAFPAFAGGTVRLDGRWPATPEGDAALALLRAGGLDVRIESASVISSYSSASAPDLSGVMAALPAEYAPFGLAFAGASVAAGRTSVMPTLAPEVDRTAVEGFLAQVGLEADEATPPLLRQVETAIAPGGWASPAPQWSMALALGSFLRSGLRIANPGNVTELMPAFWAFFNGLPSPDLSPKPKEPTNDKPTRRRIIAG